MFLFHLYNINREITSCIIFAILSNRLNCRKYVVNVILKNKNRFLALESRNGWLLSIGCNGGCSFLANICRYDSEETIKPNLQRVDKTLWARSFEEISCKISWETFSYKAGSHFKYCDVMHLI